MELSLVTNRYPVKNEQVALSIEQVSKGFNLIKPPNAWQRFTKQIMPKAPSKDGENGYTKRPVLAVDNVTFSVPRGEIFGVLGPNGSGKSTLIRLMCTLLSADSGKVEVFGYDINKEEMQVKRLISRVSVDAAFFKKLSPMENLVYGARLYGLSGQDAITKAQQILERLGLDKATFKESMEDMSRGMQQKVAIARAFLTTPVLLLLDEPTTGLDPRSKHEVRSFIDELRDTHDATIIITTHDMEEADYLCDRIAIIDDGKIIALDTPEGLKQMVTAQNGHKPTLEEVFMQLTGKKLVDPNAVEGAED